MREAYRNALAVTTPKQPPRVQSDNFVIGLSHRPSFFARQGTTSKGASHQLTLHNLELAGIQNSRWKRGLGVGANAAEASSAGRQIEQCCAVGETHPQAAPPHRKCGRALTVTLPTRPDIARLEGG